MDLKDWRQEYNKYKLDEKTLTENPIDFFKKWFDQAVLDKNDEPNAMSISTCYNNIPSSRYVLLKEIEDNKFVFYSNYKSKKAKEMELNPRVSLLFYWPMSQRQIRISGTVEKGDRNQSEDYFKTRPIDSQIAAMASPQSHEISIEQLLDNIETIVKSEKVSCPEHWGSYKVTPTEFEFWQGQPARLHDRIVYTLENNIWSRKRIAP